MTDETTPANLAATTGEFAGWRIMITGGSSGIGLATGLRFVERGASVVSLDLARPDDTRLAWRHCDVAEDSSVREAVAAGLEDVSGLDVVVNSAGVGMQGTIEESPELAETQWRRLFEVNVLGVMRVTRASLPALRQSPHASVVNIASFVALTGVPRRAAYGASKGAVFSLTKALAADHLGEGIRVNSSQPGYGRHSVDRPTDRRHRRSARGTRRGHGAPAPRAAGDAAGGRRSRVLSWRGPTRVRRPGAISSLTEAFLVPRIADSARGGRR